MARASNSHVVKCPHCENDEELKGKAVFPTSKSLYDRIKCPNGHYLLLNDENYIYKDETLLERQKRRKEKRKENYSKPQKSENKTDGTTKPENIKIEPVQTGEEIVKQEPEKKKSVYWWLN